VSVLIDAGLIVITGQLTAIVNVLVAMHAFASVALMSKVVLPTTVGVPLTAPVVEFNVKPVGSKPTTLQV
jgi:hypothetical protein